MEWQANAIASTILMPKQTFIKAIGNILFDSTFPSCPVGKRRKAAPEKVLPFNLAPRLDTVSRGQQGIPFRSTNRAAAPGEVWAAVRQTGPRRAAPMVFVVRCICHAPPARGVFQAAVGSGCHSSTAPPPPWGGLACAAGLPRKSVGGREQVSLSPALSSRPACHSRVKGSR